MKLTLIGGAGVRTPLMIGGLIRRHGDIPIDTLCIHDVSRERIEVIGAIVRHLVQIQGEPFKVEFTDDIVQAVRDADFIYTAIRVGGEEGRAADERIALQHGVLGQETTGPGGFSMALRTIPVMLEYARVIERYAPDAWVVNFTNPAGLITEALMKHTKLKIIGICDAPSAMKLEIAKFLDVSADDIHLDYAGLNHLGWVRRVLVDGKDRLPEIIDGYSRFTQISPHMSSFAPELIRRLGLLPNEYLYYYYYREEAVGHILQSPMTRGEQIHRINAQLISRLGEALQTSGIEEALRIYASAMTERQNSYMTAETGSRPQQQEPSTQFLFENEGYAGLAMSILSSIHNNCKTNLILNVKNDGVLGFLQQEDVIEATCLLDRNGPVPFGSAALPDHASNLVQAVKLYERHAVSAAVTGSYEDALTALAVHPLVCSHSLAQKLLDDYLKRFRPYLPQFQ